MKFIYVLFGIILLNLSSTATFAKKPVICGSDWPVWEAARGLDATGQLNEFNFIYRKYSNCIISLKQGASDAVFISLYDFIYTQRDSQNAVIVAATDYSSGGDRFYVRNDIKSAEDLKGQTLVLQTDSVSLWLAHLYLQKSGLSLEDVQVDESKGENVGLQFQKFPNLYAGAVGWNPNFDMIEKKHGHLVASSADFPENIFSVLVIQKKSLEMNSALYKELINKWFLALNDSQLKYKIAEQLKVDVNTYNSWLEDAVIYKTKEESLKVFAKMRKVSEEVNKFLNKSPPKSVLRGATKERFGEKQLNIGELFDPSLIQ